MSKTFEVAKYEYTHHVARPRFWIALLSVPVGIVLVTLFAVAVSLSSMSKLPVGYVDEAKLITIPFTAPEKPSLFEPVIPMIPFSSEEEARASAERGEIQAYFVIPEGYESTFQIKYSFNEPLTSTIRGQIRSLLSQNLLAGMDIPNQARLEAGSLYTLVSLDGTRSTGENEISKILVPLVVGLLFVIVVISSGGYLLQAVVEEKENRTIEIMLTSVPPREIMAGKIIGNLSVGLTQIIVWVLLLGIAGFVFRNQLGFLADINLSGSYVAISVALMVLSFLFSAALMATIGAAMTSTEESQGVIGLMVIPMMFPFYFFSVFLSNPNGILARVLSFIPLSAPLALSLRMAFSSVSPLEIGLIFVVIILLTLLMFWLSGVVFKRGMLQYSKRLSLKEIFNKETRNA